MSDLQDTRDTEPPRPRRRKRRVALWLLTFVMVLVLGLGAGLYAMIGRPVDAPPWLRERIEQRIATALPGITVDFGRMSLLVQDTGLARFILWDVTIRNAEGALVAQLSDIEAGVAPVSFLKRQWELREAQVSGAFVTLQRDRSGRLGLALGDAFADGTEVPDIGQMVAQVDAIAMDPRLASLDLFEADSLTLRYEDLRARRGWTADGGRLRLLRDDGRLSLSGDVALLSGGDGVATVEVAAASDIGATAFDFAVTLHDLASGDIATQSPALSWLDALEAPISGALRSSLDEDGGLGEMNATLEIGAGVLQPNRETRPLPFEGARTYFTYDPARGHMRFDEISVTSQLVTVQAEGHTQLDAAGPDGRPAGLTAQFTLSDIAVNEDAVLEQAVELSGADVAFRLKLDPFEVDLGALRVTDPAFPVRAEGTLRADAQGWNVSLDATADEVSAEQIKTFWPQKLNPNTRDWVTRNVREGRVHDVIFALRAEPGQDKPRSYFDLGFDGATVSYAPNLPPVSDGRGRLTIYDRRLGLRLDAGTIGMGQAGAVEIGGSEFIVPDLRARPSQGELRVALSGPLSAVLAYVDNDQWRVLRKAGRDATLARGRVAATGRLSLPLVKGLTFADVDLSLTGTVREVESSKVVPGKVLTADALDVVLNGRGMEVSGAADLSGMPVEGRWTQPFGSGTASVAARVGISPGSLASFGIRLPSGMLRGSGSGAFNLSLPKGAPPRFELTSDLAGVGLAIPQIGWSLAPNTRGTFKISGRLGQPVEVESLSLTGAGLSADGRLVLGGSGGFERLDLTRLRVADWLDVAGRLVGRGTRPPAVEISSGRVDLRSAPFGNGAGGGASTGEGAPLSLTLNSLRVTDSIELQDFRGDFVTTRGLEGAFTARLGGATPIEGQVIPQNGGSAVRVTGEDAGDVLKASGLYKTAQDGTFRLDLAPVRGQPGSYDGLAVIREVRMQKAPAIASLLDAISVVGILDQLNGPGIFFSDVEARFRLTPSSVIVTESSAVGPSMGISLDGYYDLASGRMDMQGVLSPIYVVNAIGRLISRKGEGLIGFNFNLRGTVQQPQVSVNPLSALTPGMFREIFRRPPPKVSQ